MQCTQSRADRKTNGRALAGKPGLHGTKLNVLFVFGDQHIYAVATSGRELLFDKLCDLYEVQIL